MPPAGESDVHRYTGFNPVAQGAGKRLLLWNVFPEASSSICGRWVPCPMGANVSNSTTAIPRGDRGVARTRILWLLVPLLAGYAAWTTGALYLKLAVPATCALLLVCGESPFRIHRDVGWVILAFVASLIGDTFLSTRAGRDSFYIAGIAAFFVAHLGYLGFALRNGTIHRGIGLGLLAGYVGWFLWQLGPAIHSAPLKVAAFAYLLISCAGLAAACGLRLKPAVKVPYIAGIGLIVFSDTLIARSDFLKLKAGSVLILPTYYLAQVLVTWALHARKPRVASASGAWR